MPARRPWSRVLVLTALLAVPIPPLRAQETVPPEVMAKNLAENVLGEGTVRRVRVSGGGRFVEITWEAVLYRASNTVERNRDQLRGEAQLATGSIMGVMRPEVIRFTMVRGTRTIASGRRTSTGEFTIVFAKELGG